MKTKISFSKFFTLLFTVLLTITAQAQIKHLTANGNNTADSSNHFGYKTGDEFVRFFEKGEVLPGVVGVAGCDATCVTNQSLQGSLQVQKAIVNNVVQSNNHSRALLGGKDIVTQADYDAALKVFESTLYVADVDFGGNTINEMYLAYDPATGKYGNGFDNTGVHQNVHIKKSVISKQAGKDYIIADAACGQNYDPETMMMTINGKAKVLPVTGATPANQPNQPSANNGNVGGAAATGNGNVSIPIPSGSTGNMYFIFGNGIGNGIGNGTSNGGQGGQGGTATANNSLPTGTGNAGAGATNAGGFNFGGFVPGAGAANGAAGTTTTPPGAGATSSTATNVAGPDYTKPLTGIANGTKATGAGTIITGAAGVSREIRQWGQVFGLFGGTTGTTGGATIGGGLVRDPG